MGANCAREVTALDNFSFPLSILLVMYIRQVYYIVSIIPSGTCFSRPLSEGCLLAKFLRCIALHYK